jgi:hypothetical protein
MQSARSSNRIVFFLSVWCTEGLTDLDNLPEPNELAEEIIENLEAGLDSFREILAGLSKVA